MTGRPVPSLELPSSAILSPRAVAAYLGVTVRTLDRWRADPAVEFPPAIELSPHRIGWRREELDHWLASRPRRGVA